MSYDSYGRDRRYDDRRGTRYVETEETAYLKPHSQSRELIPRRREDSDLSVETVHRDFPPPTARDVRRARSAEPGYYYDDPREYEYSQRTRKGPGSALYYEEEERARRKRVMSKQEKILAAFAGAALAMGGKEVYDRYDAKAKDHEVQRNALTSAALGAAGAVAGYQGAEFYSKHSSKDEKKSKHAVYQGRDGRLHEFYSDDDDHHGGKKTHKKFLESVLGVTSLGAVMKGLMGDEDKHRHRGYDERGRGRSRSSSRSSRSHSGGLVPAKVQKMALASLIAGASEAFRVSKEPGSWKGEKAKRVVTAAIGAGGIGAVQGDKDSKKDIFESVIGGLLGNRLMHGSKKNIEEDEVTGRSRSRSRARGRSDSHGGHGALGAIATTGLGAYVAKKALDRRGSDSEGSRSPSRRRRSRSRSVVDGARRSLAKFGIGNGPEDEYDDRRRRYSDDYSDDYRGTRRTRSLSRSRSRSKGPRYDDDRDYRPRGAKSNYSESDLGDSDDDEKELKKMKDRRHRRGH